MLAGALESPADLRPGNAYPDSVYFSPAGATTAAAAIANGQYFDFTLTATKGNALSLMSLTFDEGNGGLSPPRGFVIRSSRDGFASDVYSTTTTAVIPTLAHYSVDLTGSSFQGAAGDVTFRVYAFVPGPGQGLYFDNITLNGSVQAVPEPTSMAALGIGAVGFLRRRKRA